MKWSAKVEKFRIKSGPLGSRFAESGGAFLIPGPLAQPLTIIASSGSTEVPWEHVSVSTPRRCPNWIEMSFVKDLFWDEEETVLQIHPPRSQYVNKHEYCLHLWKPVGVEIALPPREAVG